MEKEKTLENSLSDLAGSVATNQLNKLGTVEKNLRYGLISTNRNVLSELYVEHGIVQTLIDQPVEDAFSRGIEVKTNLINEDQLIELTAHVEKIADRAYMEALKWSRLYGGAALIIIDDKELDTPLDIEKVTEKSNIRYYAADCWELMKPYYCSEGVSLANKMEDRDYTEDDYLFYGKKVDKTRVIEVHGKKAPSVTRQRLRGWGMSEVERLIRSINQYIKNNNVIFELLDEAKVDVYKIQHFNQALLTATGTQGAEKRIQLGNQIKNYLNALVMDSEDDYEQKNMQFSGLAEMLQEIRMGIAADMKMPLTKIFGMSATGFNSGEDDIENYNSMIESSVRRPSIPLVKKIYEIEAYRLFQVVLEDLEIEFPSLRVLNAEQEEQVKNNQFERLARTFEMGLIDIKQFKESANKASLLPVQLDVNDNLFKEKDEGEF